MTTELKYPVVVVWSKEDDAFLATALQLDGCVADGATQQEALENLSGVVQEWLESAKQRGWKIPAPMSDGDLERMHEDRESARMQQTHNACKQAFEAGIEEGVREALKKAWPVFEAKLQALQLEEGPHMVIGQSYISWRPRFDPVPLEEGPFAKSRR